MFKKMLIVVGIAINASAMDNQQPYGCDINTISVSTLIQALNIPIGDATTVLNVKEHIRDTEGIPMNQQHIYIIWNSGLITPTGEAQYHSLFLLDDYKVNEVMALYQTDTFGLCLSYSSVLPLQNNGN